MRYVLVPAEKGVKSIEIDVPDEIVKRSIKTKMTCKPIFVKKKCNKQLKSSSLLADARRSAGPVRGPARPGPAWGGGRARGERGATLSS